MVNDEVVVKIEVVGLSYCDFNFVFGFIFWVFFGFDGVGIVVKIGD